MKFSKAPNARCWECVFKDAPFVPTQNPHPRAKLAVCGEAPGSYEAARGIPFTGPSGRLLDQVLAHNGYARSEVMVTNVTLCRPTDNSDPPKSAIACCKPRLDAELAASGVEKILAVGGTAASALINPKKKISSLRIGPPKPYIENPQVQVVASWHPAFCLRVPDAFPSLVSDTAKLRGSTYKEWTAPNYRVFDNEVALQAIERLNNLDGPIIIDIETGVDKDDSYEHPNQYNLLCLGIAYAKGKVVVFGENALKLISVQEALGDYLRSHPLIAHNGKSDLAGLRPIFGELTLFADTMLKSYALDERPGHHALGKLGIEILGTHDWKAAFKRLIPSGGNYGSPPRSALYKYNSIDCGATWDLNEYFESRMGDRERQQHEFQVQASNAVINLELAGITFDVPYSVELQEKLEKELYEIEVQISNTTGRNLNPRSPMQIMKWFVEQGMNLPHTQAELLEGLLEKPIKNNVKEFIEQLLLHRRRTKLNGTYVKGFQKRIHNGKVYTTYTLHGTTSGRLASKNPNMQNICVSDDTTILTDSGWKLFSELDRTERVAQWWQDGTIDFVYPEAYIDLEYNDKLIHILSDSVDQLVTPDHTVISRARRQETVFRDKASTWLRWAPYTNIDRKFVRGGNKTGGRYLTDNERITLEQAIAYQADGCVRHDMPDRGLIRVTSSRKREQLRSLFTNIRDNKLSLDAWFWLEEINEWIYTETKNFKIDKIAELSKDDLLFFLECIMRWDGDFTRGKTYLQTPERDQSVIAVQIAAILSGKSTKWYDHPNGYKVINIHPKSERACSNTSISTIDYNGHVYCVTVPSGAIIIRRNNQVSITGNCRDKRIKHQFTVENEENILVMLDYKQAEGRVIATLARDEYLAGLFRDPTKDIFNDMCDQIYGFGNYGKEERVKIKSVFYGLCVPLSTKILTRRGWLTYDKVIPNVDETIGYDPKLNKSRWTKIEDVLTYNDVGVHSFGHSNINFETTPNHRWISEQRKYVNGKRQWVQQFTTTKDINGDTRLLLAFDFDSDSKLDITDQEAAILGWAYSDGTVKISQLTGITAQGDDGRRRQVLMRICQDKNNVYSKTINDLLNDYEHNKYEYANSNQIWWSIPSPVARDLLIRANLIDGCDPIQFALSLSNSQRKAFFNAVDQAEGTKSTNIISQSSGWLNEVIKIVGYLEGYLVKSHLDNSSETQRKNHFKHRLAKPILTGQTIHRYNRRRTDVWCVKTELGTWTMQQNGLTVLTGNSYGREAASIGRELSISLEEARELLANFKALIPATVSWQASITHRVLSGEDLITPYGRKRSFWLITDKNKKDVINEALSFLPQSIASDICLTALIKLQPRLRDLATTRLTIHDAMILECLRTNAEEVINIASEEMILAGEAFTTYVPFVVDVSQGSRWSEL